MLILSKQNFKKAEGFIKEKGRALEKALFNYYFVNGTAEEVLSELSKYQNEDGGFGNALESDARLEASNCLATSVAFQILCKLNIDSENNMVKRGIGYLVQNYKPEFKGWLFFPPEVDQAPRAMWWNYDGNADNKYNCNPSAEIAGYLARYKELVPQDIVNEAVDEALKYLDKNRDTIGMHDIFCCQRLSKSLLKEQEEFIMDRLRKRVRSVIQFDTEKWSGYDARPLSFIHSPSDRLASELSKEELNINLDYLIREQQEDGSWAPRWNWGRYEEEWIKAQREWAGVVTLENLCVLKAFSRIEE